MRAHAGIAGIYSFLNIFFDACIQSANIIFFDKSDFYDTFVGQ